VQTALINKQSTGNIDYFLMVLQIFFTLFLLMQTVINIGTQQKAALGLKVHLKLRPSLDNFVYWF
jgi:hypothetical protein